MNISVTGMDRAVRLLVWFYVSVRVARHLQPEGFGILSYAVAFVGVFGPIQALGLDNLIVQDLIRSPERRGETMGSAFCLRLVSGLLVVGAAVALTAAAGNPQKLRLVMVLAAAIFFQSMDVADFWFQAQVKALPVVLARQASLWTASAWRIYLVHAGGTPLDFAWAAFGEAALYGAGLAVAYVAGGGVRWHPSLARAKALLRDGWPLALSGVAIIIYLKIDQVMLGWMVGNRAVGLYAVAARLSEVWLAIPGILLPSLFPIMVRSKDMDPEVYRQRLQKTFDVMALLAWVIIIPLSLGARQIVLQFYGAEYAEAIPVLRLHVWGNLLVFVACVQALWETSESLMRLSFAKAATGAAVNVLLNLFLIPVYGPWGAAVATIAAYLVAGPLLTSIIPATRETFRMQVKAVAFHYLWQKRPAGLATAGSL